MTSLTREMFEGRNKVIIPNKSPYKFDPAKHNPKLRYIQNVLYKCKKPMTPKSEFGRHLVRHAAARIANAMVFWQWTDWDNDLEVGFPRCKDVEKEMDWFFQMYDLDYYNFDTDAEVVSVLAVTALDYILAKGLFFVARAKCIAENEIVATVIVFVNGYKFRLKFAGKDGEDLSGVKDAFSIEKLSKPPQHLERYVAARHFG